MDAGLQSTVAAAFSLRRVDFNYDGPVIKLSHSPGGAATNFYTSYDFTTSMYGLVTSNGTSFSDWAGDSTGYVAR